MKNRLLVCTLVLGSLLGISFSSTAYAAGAVFTFTYNGQSFPVSQDTFSSWKGRQAIMPNNILITPPIAFKSSLFLALGQTHEQDDTSRFYGYKLSSIYNFLKSLTSQVNATGSEPSLTIENGKVTKFTPPANGLTLDVYKTSFQTLQALESGKNTLELTVYTTTPQKQLSETNSLGINELIAEGVSSFKGSPNNRRHNITVGITKFAGVLVAANQQFSFDDNLGPVTAEAGFLPELVIKGSEGTVPELGGGLCQVSTTTFRAAMQAGLPITARRNHAYAVQYYSPQGTDATIYPGSADLKFINDTPGYILIWPYERDKNTLVFDFYGTKDSRQVVLDKPNVYDRQSDGSMKATWTRHVSLNGITRDDVFKSVYQSPALFHKTESFVSATGTQTSGLKMPKVN